MILRSDFLRREEVACAFLPTLRTFEREDKKTVALAVARQNKRKRHFKYTFAEAEYLCSLYLDDDQQIAQADDQQRTEEAHGARVYDK